MILALECDYCDDSESYNLRLTLSPGRHGKSIAPTPYAISNHDRICSKEYLYSTLTTWSYQSQM
jgi:hypothetical protein